LVRYCGDHLVKSKVFVNPDVFIDSFYVTVVKEKLHMLYFLRIGFGVWVIVLLPADLLAYCCHLRYKSSSRPVSGAQPPVVHLEKIVMSFV